MFNTLKHVNRIVPAEIRTEFNVNFIWTMLSPLQTLNTDFEAWKTEMRTNMSYNGQAIHLERCLNDLFDPTLRRIAIIHNLTSSPYAHFTSEVQPPMFLNFHSEAEAPDYISFYFELEEEEIDGFLVRIPTLLTSKENEIRGQILKYKLSTVKYDIDFLA